MWPDRVSNPGPLTYKSGVLPTALCGSALQITKSILLNFAIITILPFLYNPKDLDPSYKMNLDFKHEPSQNSCTQHIVFVTIYIYKKKDH